MIRFLNAYPFMRGAFLAMLGPLLGFSALSIICPLLLIVFIAGPKAWFAIYEVGLVPSAATAALLILMQETARKKIIGIMMSVGTGAISSVFWVMILSHSASQASWPTAIAGGFGGLFLAIINRSIYKSAHETTTITQRR
ncbi:hypothetical protein [Sphingomonas oryzagri]|uniref:Uncharacterized protein n=1 Tax=Sphingomonas oryzagri TaxID=3042314 RepID=A0ABT6MZD2_9SPHN|nr:hypothetical protein [Sphingomonas oryzagri]MDH7638429.1 hypothetical protein [Sphingomonas oryzagri]